MSKLSLRHYAALPLALVLAACDSDKSADPALGDEDPALTGALGDQIMVDPDLTGQNRGNAAIAGGGPATGEIPANRRTPEAIAAAKADAAKLAGGTLRIAPAPGSTADSASAAMAGTAGSLAEIAGSGMGTDCGSKVDYTATWAAKLPAAFPVYPRGAVQEAAGTDKDGCRLRVVNFLTPVAVSDVINFYYTRAASSGFATEYKLEAQDHVLGGSKGAAAYLIYARKLPNGLTEVDLIANGG